MNININTIISIILLAISIVKKDTTYLTPAALFAVASEINYIISALMNTLQNTLLDLVDLELAMNNDTSNIENFENTEENN